MKPIFNQNAIDNYSQDFHLANIPNIRKIKLVLDKWIEELDAGKLPTLKEEEIKSRFVDSQRKYRRGAFFYDE